MRVWLAIGAAAVVTAAGLWWTFGGRADSIVRRDLPGVGYVAVPERLEGRSPDVSPQTTVFRFDLIAGGFGFMGSTTPVRERLVVVAWNDIAGARAAAVTEARQLVADRVEGLRWRVDGGIERGDGTYVVNTRERKSLLTLLVIEADALVVAHRVWVDDAGPAESVDLVRRVAVSFRRDTTRPPSSR